MMTTAEGGLAYQRWLQRNVHAHQVPGWRAVTLSVKRAGQAPGDASADQLDALAELVEQFSAGEARVTHDQNVMLPWVRVDQLHALWQRAKALGVEPGNMVMIHGQPNYATEEQAAVQNSNWTNGCIALLNQDMAELWELVDPGTPIEIHP